MYRARIGNYLDKDALEFLSSVNTDSHLLYYDVLGSEAHIIMLNRIGLVSTLHLRKLLVELEKIRKNPKILATEKYEDIHECVEAYLISQLGYEVGGLLQTARSRNDQVILDIRMMIRDFINKISREILNFISALLSKCKGNFRSIMPMYTHLQHAQLGTFSHFLLSYVDNHFRDLDRLDDAYGRINSSPLGACAIGGSIVSIDRNMTASLLGFKGVTTNSIDATTSRDDLMEYLSTLTILMLNLSRIAEDIILWSTSEFGYVEVPDSYSSTSSLMPQKKNPDILELIRARTALVSSSLSAIISIVKGLPSGYSRDLQEFKPELIRSSRLALDSVKILAGLVLKLKINHNKMKEASYGSYAISTDIAERLVLEKGISFRSAHSIMGSLVNKAVSRGSIPLSMLTSSEIRKALENTEHKIQPQDISAIIKNITPEKVIELRQSYGSPSLRGQRNQYRIAVEQKERYYLQTREREKKLGSTLSDLLRLVENLEVKSSHK